MKSNAFSVICALLSVALLSLAAPVMTSNAANVISHAEIIENAAKGLRLLSLSENSKPVWRTEEQIFALIKQRKQFVRIVLSSAPSRTR